MNVRARSVALLLSWLVVGIGAASAADPAPPVGKKITVTGSATVSIKPDAARLVFGVTTNTPDAKGARMDNEKQVKKMRESLVALGYKDLDIQAVPGSVNSVQMNDPMVPAGPVLTKQVQTVITVTVREADTEKLRAMVVKLSDTATENGGTSVFSDDFSPFGGRMAPGRLGRAFAETTQGPQIDWLTQEMGEARREAIKKAVRDAKANALAVAPDAKLEMVEVTVNSAEGIARQRFRQGPYGIMPDSNGQSLTVEVQVTFSY